MSDALTATGVRYSFGANEVLHGVDLQLSPGRLTALLGPNGSGKSTLLRILAGLANPSSGTVLLGSIRPSDLSPRDRARRIALLPQNEEVSSPFTVRELALMSRFATTGASVFETAEDRAAVDAVLQRAGVSTLAERLVSELSGGERQRAALARSLVNDPDLLLLDEPASNLDPAWQISIYESIRAVIEARACPGLVVSHDINLSAAFAAHVVLIRGGRVVAAGPPPDVLRPEILEQVYDCRFDSASVAGRSVPLLVPRAAPGARA